MSKSSATVPNVNSLFGAAVAAGDLTRAAAAVLTLPDYGAQIQAGLGVKVDDVPASEVFLVGILVDDSGSIRFASNAQAVRDGHNGVMTALKDSKQGSGILVHCRYLNGTILYEVVPLDQAVEMTAHNYDPNGCTPLYDQAIVLLGTIAAKAQEFADAGVVCRTATLLVTDGNDEHSRARAVDVKKIVDAMLKAERHIVAGLGVDDGSTNFRQVFRDMGIRDEWMLTPGNTPSEVRRAFQVFSRSAVRASQSAAGFSKTAAGGFGTP
ncbi:MAG: hypothetical protein V1723_02610 [Candidatus Uhrbacteria bacterium]